MVPPIILSSTILFSIIPSSTQFNPAQFNITLCTAAVEVCRDLSAPVSAFSQRRIQSSTACHRDPKIAQLVATHPKLTTLNAAVKAAGLEATLASPGPFTVFA